MIFHPRSLENYCEVIIQEVNKQLSLSYNIHPDCYCYHRVFNLHTGSPRIFSNSFAGVFSSLSTNHLTPNILSINLILLNLASIIFYGCLQAELN